MIQTTHGDDQSELPREKNNAETEVDSSSAHVTASNKLTDALYLPQDFTSSNSTKKLCQEKKSSSTKRIISSYSSSGKRFVTFTLAPVDGRHCRLRLPVQFTRENGINKPGKIFLLGIDGSKWLANLLLESRGRMTLGDGWKSFVKANGLKIGESYTLELDWEDTIPMLSLCPAEYIFDRRAREKESLPIEPSNGNIIINDENSKEESSSWERDKYHHLRLSDSTSSNENRFLTITITPDSLRHGRLRLPLEFMWENRINTPGVITLLGKDGAKWLVSLLLERRGRMCLGKGWKEFSKANGLKTGDSITLESIWEHATPVLSLIRIVSSSEYSKAREKESISTQLVSGNKTKSEKINREESRKYPLSSNDSSLAIQNQYGTSTLSCEIDRIGEIFICRDDGDVMFKVPDLEASCSQIQDLLAPSSNNDQQNISSFSSYDGDDQFNIELPRKKKVKKNNSGTEADSSSDRSRFLPHVSASNQHTDTLLQYLPQDLTSSDDLKRICLENYSPTQIISTTSSTSEQQVATFTLAPVDVRNCRLRLPMQFTRENGINKPGKIYLLGKDGSKWLANLLVESRGRMTLGDGWKSFVKANGLKTGESFALKLNWEDSTPVLSLCSTVDSKEGRECSKEPLSIEPISEKEISKDENRLIWRDSNSVNENRFLTLTITPDSLKHGRLRLPLQFMKENSLNKPGEITLVSQDGAKWLVSLLLEKRGRMSLGKGWKDFAKADSLNTSDSITFELTWEAANPVLSLVCKQLSNDRKQSEFLDQSLSTRSSSRSSSEDLNLSPSEIENRIVILTLTPEDVRDCKLLLPSQFMKNNGIIKPGKITLLGRSDMKWFAYLLSKDGIVSLGNGWRGFCEANGVMLGESFVLEFVHREETNLMFKFCSNFDRPNT